MVRNLFNNSNRPDGKKYKGRWVDGRQHGIGTYITSNGQHRDGEWVQGKRARWLDENDSI